MKDLRRASRKIGFKQQSAGPWELSQSKELKHKDGVCPACNEYDTELNKFGFCREIDCKRDRVVSALKRGEAMMLPNGTLLWMQDGTKIVDHGDSDDV